MVIIDRDAETGVVVGTVIGPLTMEEIRRSAASVWRDVEGPRLRVLWDVRKARFEFSTVEVRALAEFDRQNSPYADLRMAFVVTRDLEFGLVRIFEALRETARAGSRSSGRRTRRSPGSPRVDNDVRAIEDNPPPHFLA